MFNMSLIGVHLCRKMSLELSFGHPKCQLALPVPGKRKKKKERKKERKTEELKALLYI